MTPFEADLRDSIMGANLPQLQRAFVKVRAFPTNTVKDHLLEMLAKRANILGEGRLIFDIGELAFEEGMKLAFLTAAQALRGHGLGYLLMGTVAGRASAYEKREDEVVALSLVGKGLRVWNGFSIEEVCPELSVRAG